MSEIIVGIDLGTTNSEVSVIEGAEPKVIPVAETSFMLPSAVGVDDHGELLIGQAAKNQYVIYPERTVLSVKRHMGSDTVFNLSGTEYRPEQISAIILKQLKQNAEAYLGQPVSKAVITVPAYFSDAQRQATKKAGELAGLEVVRMINEPTAASLVYNAKQDEEKTILVYDLGGGTFDVSIVLMRKNVLEVLASHGNNQLGGNDFDGKIVEHINQYLADNEIDISHNKKAQARIRAAAEIAKIQLSDNPYALINEEYLTEHQGKPYHLSLELSREEYEELIKPYIDETFSAIQTALTDAKLTANDIEEILLVGGSTKTPIISSKLESIFYCPLHADINPDLCVAMGAAVQAGIIAGKQIETRLVDITPYTFGTSCVGEVNGEFSMNQFVPIIKKNTALPTNKSEVFFTMADYQPKVEIKIFQGESPDAEDNILLGNFVVSNLSKVASGNPIILNLRLDLNGILNVTAIEKKTGLKKSITISNTLNQVIEQEFSQAQDRIDQLFYEETVVHDDSQLMRNAQKTIEKAQASIEQLGEEDQEELIELIAGLKEAMEQQNANTIDGQMEAIKDMLYYCLESA